MAFLPITKKEIEELGWDVPDFVLVTGDTYVDHPTFGVAIISRLLESYGYKIAILAQPDWRTDRDFTRFGQPKLGFMVTAGNIDSMVAHYTAARRKRNDDAYSPGGKAGKRPDRAVTVYTKKIKEIYPDSPVVIAGLEASLRRFAHYDYWDNEIRPSVLIESGANLLSFGMGNITLNRYYNGMSNRKYTPEVRALYDDYLFSMIQQAGALASKKQCIDEYENAVYLEEGKRKHTVELEYTKDSVDYELMKPEINSSSKLELIQGFLLTHKYREFRDKAHELRSQFEDSVVWITPSSTKYYKKGMLMKSEAKLNNKITTEVYSYLPNGKPAGIDITSGNMQFHTSFFYDAQDRCAQEIQINTKTKKEIYKRERTFNAGGTVQSDSLKYTDGKLILRSYNRQGKLIEEKEYHKDVMLSSTVHQYDSKGEKVKSQYVLPLPKNPLPTQISSRTDVYEYDKYGYLTKIVSTQILVNNEKRICSQYFMYDEYGNQIDSDMYYEYDQTGQWIRKTAKNNPEITEQKVVK